MSDVADQVIAAALAHLRAWGPAGGLRRVFVRIETVAGTEYLLLGRSAPRYRGTVRTEVWHVDCVDIVRVAQGFPSPGAAGTALGSDLIEPLGRVLTSEVAGIVYLGDARELFASKARAGGFDPRDGAEILVLSEEPWREPPTSQDLQQRARREERIARGEVTVTYDGRYPSSTGLPPTE